jgi:cytidylate kinase
MTVIVMSGETGPRSADIASGLAERLGLQIADPQIIEHHLAKDLNVEPIRVHRCLQRRAWLMTHLKVDGRQLSIHLAAQFLELAYRDNVLIQGWRASALLSPVNHVLSVRVCAGTTFFGRIPGRDLARITMQRLRERYWPERERFDLVLDTDRVSIASCVQEAAELAQSPRFQENNRSRAKLAEMLQAVQAQANRISSGTVVADGLNFTLFENATSEEAIASVERHLRGVNGLEMSAPKGICPYNAPLSRLI